MIKNEKTQMQIAIQRLFFFFNLSDVSINTPIKVLEILVGTICVS